MLTSPSVTAPADGGQASVEVGHYNTVDRVPPPPPTLSPGTAALSSTSLVTITAESGAIVRYTLDGTAPTASRGMLYTAPVRISTDRVLRAVAVDPAGNASEDAVASYDLPWSGHASRRGTHCLVGHDGRDGPWRRTGDRR